MLEYIKLEVRRTLRDPGFVIFGTGMPVLMYLLFTNLGGGAGPDDMEWKIASMVGMAAYGALGAAVGTGTGIAEDKSLGWLRQLRITPMPPRQVVLGRALAGSVTVLPALLAVLAAGGLVNGVRLALWQWAALVALLWAGALPFTLLGIGNGYRLSAQTTGVVNVGCLMVLALAGGLWFPIAAFPGWLRTIAEYTPANRFADLGWSTTQGTAPGATTTAVLAGWLVVFGSYAVFSYRRSARTT
ncbi:ABC transporter permease [Streptomyces scopuliridis]|uniref:ABC transporter permease n=1 Tax=Streptomyces scopuliridis TaxID=452529 RepID=A0ACD4ZXW3_9ACTN|nr:ABC transporter permease [Streptomyces scopuliridis]WSC03224.1 ABC transporter permease [Streptomyces scopuliridis]WSC10897.1 ABC transporter permease [Streptomyces scopuliridis]